MDEVISTFFDPDSAVVSFAEINFTIEDWKVCCIYAEYMIHFNDADVDVKDVDVKDVDVKDVDEEESEEEDSQIVDSYDNYIEIPNSVISIDSYYDYLVKEDEQGNPVFDTRILIKIDEEGKYIMRRNKEEDVVVDKVYYNSMDDSYEKVLGPKVVGEEYYYYEFQKDNDYPVFKRGNLKKETDEGKYIIDNKEVDKLYRVYVKDKPDDGNDEDPFGDIDGGYQIGEKPTENNGGKRRNKSKKNGKKSNKRQTRKANK